MTGTEPDDLPTPPPPRGAGQTAWVGLFLIIGVVAVLGSLFVFTDAAIFRGRYIVTALVDDAAGIRKGDPVQMKGVNIGRVMGFQISHDQVAIKLEIEGEYPIPADSHVELRSVLLGGVAAVVIPGTSRSVLHYGDTLPGRKQSGLTDTADKLASQAEASLDRVQQLLDPETVDNVRASSAELKALLGDLSETVSKERGEVSKLVASLRRNSEGVERATSGPELERAVKRLDDVTSRMDDLTRSLQRSGDSLESILGRIDRGEGTLGRLARDRSLYDNLNQSVTNMNKTLDELHKLTADIRKDPKKYLHLSLF